MKHFAVNRFSHVRPARPAFFLAAPGLRDGSRRTALGSLREHYFEDATERRMQQEDRLIALGLLVCFVVQALVWLF